MTIILDRGPSPFESIRNVVRANAAAGGFWFSPATMQHFNSRVESNLIRGRYFITSEQREAYPYIDVRGQEQPATERKYTVRYVQDDASIETIGDFMAYDSGAAAMEAALQHDQQYA
jgi:hypothetical protein